MARMVGPRLGVSRRAQANLRRALPQNSEAENARIMRGMWDNLGRSVGELAHIGTICAPGSPYMEIVNPGGVEAVLQAKRPTMFFSGHFANWEVGSTAIHQLVGPSLLSVFRETNNPYVNRLLRARLQQRRAVPKGAEGGRDLLRHLRQGGNVGMLVDQKMNDGIAIPFFGHDAMTAPAIARLALRFDCPIVPVRIERLRAHYFRLTVLPELQLADRQDSPENVVAVLKRITEVIEGWIVERPEQWLWVHNRWPN